MHLNTVQCCEHTFTAADIKGRLLRQGEVFGIEDTKLYGGNVKRFAQTSCPECGKEYFLWLKPQGQSWKVLTISSIGNSEDNQASIFDYMSKQELQTWLDERGVTYAPQTGEKRLRELCKANSEVAE